MHTIYSITDKYHLFECEPDHFCGDYAGFRLIFFVDRIAATIRLSINASLNSADDKMNIEKFVLNLIPDFETKIKIEAHQIDVRYLYSDAAIDATESAIASIVEELNRKNIQSNCARCGENRDLSLCQLALKEVKYVCEDCKEDLRRINENELARRMERAKDSKKQMKRASTKFWRDYKGRSRHRELVFVGIVFIVLLIVLGYFFDRVVFFQSIDLLKYSYGEQVRLVFSDIDFSSGPRLLANATMISIISTIIIVPMIFGLMLIICKEVLFKIYKPFTALAIFLLVMMLIAVFHYRTQMIFDALNLAEYSVSLSETREEIFQVVFLPFVIHTIFLGFLLLFVFVSDKFIEEEIFRL